MKSSFARLFAAGSAVAVLGGVAFLRLREGGDSGGAASTPPAALSPANTSDTQSGRERGQVRTAGATAEPETIVAAAASAGSSLTELAATSDDEAVVEAAFEAIVSTHAARSTRKPGADPALERAIVKHVNSERPSSVKAALEASRISLMSVHPSEAVTDAIAALTVDDQAPERRHAALDTLNLLRPDRRSETVLIAFERGLGAQEPHLVSLALTALSQSRASVEAAPEATRARLTARVLELVAHQDPGVRGNALMLLSEVPSLAPPETRYRAADRALRDPAPYVRARAAELFARTLQPAAIRALIEHAGDLALARYELPYPTLTGGTESLVHALPARKRVADAVLFAIQSLSERLSGVKPFVLTLGGRPASDAEVLENARLAQSFYAEAQARIPSAP